MSTIWVIAGRADQFDAAARCCSAISTVLMLLYDIVVQCRRDKPTSGEEEATGFLIFALASMFGLWSVRTSVACMQ